MYLLHLQVYCNNSVDLNKLYQQFILLPTTYLIQRSIDWYDFFSTAVELLIFRVKLIAGCVFSCSTRLIILWLFLLETQGNSLLNNRRPQLWTALGLFFFKLQLKGIFYEWNQMNWTPSLLSGFWALFSK